MHSTPSRSSLVILGLILIAGCARQAPTPQASNPPGKPAPASPPANLEAPPAQLKSTTYSSEGSIRQLNYAEDGRVDGFLLDNGTLVYLPKNFTGVIPALRTRVQISGTLYPSNLGRTVVIAQLISPTSRDRLNTVIAATAPPVPLPSPATNLPAPGDVATPPPPPLPSLPAGLPFPPRRYGAPPRPPEPPALAQSPPPPSPSGRRRPVLPPSPPDDGVPPPVPPSPAEGPPPPSTDGVQPIPPPPSAQ